MSDGPAAATVGLRTIFAGRRGWFLTAMLLAEFGGAMQGVAYSTVLPVVAADLDGFGLFGATLAAGNIAAVLMLSVAGARRCRCSHPRCPGFWRGQWCAGSRPA